MSTGKPWTYDPDALADALGRWLHDDHLEEDRPRVNAWLGTLLGDPMRLGRPDDPDDANPDQKFRSRVPETNVVASYVLDMDERRIYVAEIEYVSRPTLF